MKPSPGDRRRLAPIAAAALALLAVSPLAIGETSEGPTLVLLRGGPSGPGAGGGPEGGSSGCSNIAPTGAHCSAILVAEGSNWEARIIGFPGFIGTIHENVNSATFELIWQCHYGLVADSVLSTPDCYVYRQNGEIQPGQTVGILGSVDYSPDIPAHAPPEGAWEVRFRTG